MSVFNLFVDDLALDEYWQHLLRQEKRMFADWLRYGRRALVCSSHPSCLSDAFEAQFAIPLGWQIWAQGAALESRYRHWLPVQFCYMQLTHDAIVPLPIADDSVSDVDWQTLIQDLNQWLQDDQLIFHYHQGCCLMNSEKFSELPYPDFSAIAGKNLQHVLETCSVKADWLALLTEIQMWLQPHPLNQRRQGAGLPAIASLWSWGEALVTNPSLPNLMAVGDSNWVKGLVAQYQCPHIATPAQVVKRNDAVQYVLIDERLTRCRYDFTAWKATLMDVYAESILPCLQLLKQQKISQLNVFCGANAAYQLTAKQFNRYLPFEFLKSF